MNITNVIEPTNVTTSAPSITPAEKIRLETGLAQLAAFDSKLREVEHLRDAIRESGRQFALGEVSLGQAASLAGIDPMSVADTRGALRVGIKTLVRETVEDLADLVTKHRQHEVDDLADRCRKMEKGERANAKNIGIGDDDFRPSGLLEGLREQHRRTLRDSGGTITRSSLNTLAKVLGLSAPVACPADGVDDADEDFLG